MANQVPSIPPLSSITDPNTRAVLQAIVDGQRIRNGDIGDGDEKFLTVADLTHGLNGTNGASGSGGGAVRSSASKAAQSVASVIKKLSDEIMQSRIWKMLDERIVRIDTPEWFQGRFGGAIKTVENVIESSNQAMAQQLTTAVTNINGNIALAQDDIQAASDLAGATASKVTTLQTKVGAVDAAAQQALQLSASVDGKVRGTWSVKFDVNGYVAGVALGVDQQPGQPPRSNFVVRADMFAVGSPGLNDVVPFMVNDGKTYIRSALIQDAAIDNAKIANLAVDTLKIADESVSIIYFASGEYSASQTVLVENPCTLHLIGTFTQGMAKNRHLWTMDVNGSLLEAEIPIAGTLGTLAHAIDLPRGSYRLTLDCATKTGDGGCRLMVFMRYK